MNTKLYVGNLPYQTTESDLQALFEPAGQVSSINIVRDRTTGQARGFAFVEMSDVAGAQRAISELNERQVGGRSLTVNEAKPMEPRSGGYGGDGGYGGGRQKREPRW
jgi:RNA recognition motif-containing protein